MKLFTLNYRGFTTLGALCAAAFLGASAANAAIVWNLNPNDQNTSVGSSSQVFTSSGYQITATGYDNNAGIGTATDLFFKNEADINGARETGLGLTNAYQHELFAGGNGPADFIQLDLRSILSQGFNTGQISVTSVQDGEGFQLFGSNTQGTLGSAISGTFTGTAFDDKFVAIPNFGTFKFISIVASAGNVLPSAFAANITPIPEMSAVLPIIALLTAIGATSMFRRRRSERLAASA
jgi:hypothetical protein